MAVPDFQTLMRPVLQALATCRLSSGDLRNTVANSLGLDEADLQKKLPSGRQTLFANRVAWANVYLQRAGCIRRVQRGVYEATDRGRELLSQDLDRINLQSLRRFSEFNDWIADSNRSDVAIAETSEHSKGATPDERLEVLVEAVHAELESDLLERIKRIHPQEFETLVLRLLAALGYGGGKPDLIHATSYTSDGGVDGIINEDALGLDTIYVQAKRYTEQNVGRPEVQAFVGSLVGLNAHKGIFVTTSNFARSAMDYTARIEKRVILIDGKHLARLMVLYDIGVRTKGVYVVKEIDENQFE